MGVEVDAREGGKRGSGGGGGGEQGKGEAGQYSPPRHEARTNKMLRLTNLCGG